jgi:tetratricopeptide (TPR) repeat protein
MAAKKRVTKKRLKEDQLVTFTVRASQFIQQYFTQVVAGVVVLLVAAGAILVSAHMRKSASQNSEKEFALAISQYNVGDLEAAATAFGRIKDKYGSQNSGELSRFFLGKTYFAQGKYDEAMNAFDQYLAKAGKDAPFQTAAAIGKAECMEELQNFTGAADVLDRLSQGMDDKDPRYLDVVFQAGRDYEKAGSRDKAVDFYRKVSEKATGPLKDRAAVSLALVR